MIKVTVNNQPYTIPSDCTLYDLLKEQGLASLQCAIAVNEEIIVRTVWSTRILQDGDHILIIKAVQGG